MALMAERKDIGVSLKRLRDQQKTPLLFRLEHRTLHSNVGFTSGTFGGINVILCRPTGITQILGLVLGVRVSQNIKFREILTLMLKKEQQSSTSDKTWFFSSRFKSCFISHYLLKIIIVGWWGAKRRVFFFYCGFSSYSAIPPSEC